MRPINVGRKAVTLAVTCGALLLGASGPPPAGATTGPISLNHASSEEATDVAALGDSGEFLAVWCERGGARGMIKRTNGRVVRGPFTISSGRCYSIAVTQSSDAGYLVVVAHYLEEQSCQIVARSVSSRGSLGAKRILASGRAVDHVDVAARYPLGSGAMVVWAENLPVGQVPEVRGLRLDVFGRKLGGDLVIATSCSTLRYFNGVAVAGEYSRYVVVHSGCGIRARSVSFEGVPGSDRMLAEYGDTVGAAFNPRAAETLVVWNDYLSDDFVGEGSIWGRVLPLGTFGTRNFTVLGRTLGGSWDASHGHPAVTAGPEASFLLVAPHYLEHLDDRRKSSLGLTAASVVRGRLDAFDLLDSFSLFPRIALTDGTLVVVGAGNYLIGTQGVYATLESESPLW